MWCGIAARLQSVELPGIMDLGILRHWDLDDAA